MHNTFRKVKTPVIVIAKYENGKNSQWTFTCIFKHKKGDKMEYLKRQYFIFFVPLRRTKSNCFISARLQFYDLWMIHPPKKPRGVIIFYYNKRFSFIFVTKGNIRKEKRRCDKILFAKISCLTDWCMTLPK